MNFKEICSFVYRPYDQGRIIGNMDCTSDYIIPKLNFIRKPRISLEEGGSLEGLRTEKITFYFFTDVSKMLK